MQAFRGTCTEGACPKQQYSRGLCQIHYREAGLAQPSVYPECAGSTCTNRARGRRPGSLCASCRRDAGDASVLCETEGCGNLRGRRGLCGACFNAGNGLSRPPRRAPGPKRVQCERPGCKLKPHDHHSLCGKHRLNWDACIMKGCAQPIAEVNKCDKHKPGETGTCGVLRCGSPRFKAGICYRHHQERNPTKCAHPTCTFTADGIYCQPHSVGIDFAAGSWFDHVALDQLWWGRLDPDRKPTMPELTALFDRAEEAGLGTRLLARQVRIDENRLKAWRIMLGRVERIGASTLQDAA